MEKNTFASACPHDCPSACALEIERIDSHTIGKVRGAKDNSYTLGTICSKVARYSERVHHPDRLTEPLKRTGPKGSGQFAPIGWDEALDEVADRLKAITAEYGAEAIWPYYYAGTMGQLQRDGINRLRHVMGYSRQKRTICSSASGAGWRAGAGALWGSDPREIAESDLIVIWGCNAVATQINLMTHVAKAKKGQQAQVVVVDPYRTQTAEKANLHLMLQPGSDGALACAVMHLLFKEGFADWDYLNRYTDDPHALEAHLKDKTPEWAAEITGLPVTQIVQFARLYGKARNSFIRLGLGFSRARNGAHNTHAVSCLPAITGAWKARGGGALLNSGGVFHLDKTLIEGTDALDPATRELDMSRMSPVLCNDPQDIGDGPPVKGLFIQSCNPALVTPDSSRVRQAMRRDDLFVCVHEQFMTDSAKLADIVLPATTFVEHNDIYQTYGQIHLQVGEKIIEPPGECRSNHRVICDLAHRLGAKHPGFELDELDLIDQTLQRSGYPNLQEMRRARWLDCSLPFEQAHFLDGFAWPDKKFRFKADWSALGDSEHAMPSLPDHWAVNDAPSSEKPFRLITPPARNFLNSSFTETASSVKREAHPKALIDGESAAALDLASGDTIALGNALAEVHIKVEIDAGIAAKTVVVEGIWPSESFLNGVDINSLISPDSPLPAGGAVFHDATVWVKKL